jgi:pimeloyl-ACP methyl ester carboxylesterase
MTYAEMADDVRAALIGRGYRQYSLLGHSMGGKVAMIAALRHPNEAERIVVADIAPVDYPSRHLGLVKAMRALDLDGIRRRGEADARLAAAIPDPSERGFLLQNLVFDENGAHWRLNLAAIEHAMPDLVGFPGVPAGTVYQGPALFVAGARSDYVRPEHERNIHALFPAAELVRIPDAGHWLHVEQPGAFLQSVEPFLASGSEPR